VRTHAGVNETDVSYLYYGERWQHTTDGSGMLSHQLQYWAPLQFDGDTVKPLQFVDNFILAVP
jgi:hypothetical protein